MTDNGEITSAEYWQRRAINAEGSELTVQRKLEDALREIATLRAELAAMARELIECKQDQALATLRKVARND